MIHEMVEIMCRHPPGSVIDSRTPLFSPFVRDEVEVCMGNEILIPPGGLWKYKTLEFIGSYMLERSFVTLDRMNPGTLLGTDGEPVTLFMPHIRVYYWSGQRVSVETFRVIPHILMLLSALDPSDSSQISSYPLPDLMLNQWLHHLKGDTEQKIMHPVLSESFPNPQEINSIMSEAEPHDNIRYLDTLAVYGNWLPQGSLFGARESLLSVDLKKHLHTSYCAKQYHMVVEYEESSDPAEQGYQFSLPDSMMPDLMSLLSKLSEQPCPCIRCDVSDQDTELQYAFHPTLPGMEPAKHEVNLLKMDLYKLLYSWAGGFDCTASVTMETTWLDELYLVFKAGDNTCLKYYVDQVVTGGLGTHLLAMT